MTRPHLMMTDGEVEACSAWANERAANEWPYDQRKRSAAYERIFKAGTRRCYNCKMWAFQHAEGGKCLFNHTHIELE